MEAFPAATRPKLRAGHSLEGGDGRWVLRHPAVSRSVWVGDREREALELLDGEHSVEDLALEWCRRGQTIYVEPLLLLLAELREGGFLETDPDDLWAADLVAPEGLWQGLAAALAIRRPSGPLSRVLRGVAAALAPPLGSAPGVALLAALAGAGVVAWAQALSGPFVRLLTVGGSYWGGLLFLLVVNLLLSFVGAMASAAAQRRYGLPAGMASVGAVLGAPTVWVETVEDEHLTAWQRVWLYLAGPTAQAAVGALLLAAAWWADPAQAGALLAAASVAYLRLFAALCPWTDGPLTSAIASATDTPALRSLAARVLVTRFWGALSHPRSEAERRAGVHALAGLLWTAAALRLIGLLIVPQLPVLLLDLTGGLSLPDTLAAGLMLLVLVVLSLGTVTVLGVLGLILVARWVVSHPVWKQPGKQLVALLAAVAAVVGALAWLGVTAPAAFGLVAPVLAAAGGLAGWVAGVLVYLGHRGGRLRLPVMPLCLATLPAWVLVAWHGWLPATTLGTLATTVSLLLGLFALGWAAYVWRSPLGFVGLGALGVAYGLALVPGFSSWAEVAVALLAVGAVVAVMVAQARTWLAPTWLLLALGALLPAVARLTAPSEALPALESSVVFATVALLLGGALLQWVWALWSSAPAETPASAAPRGELAAHLARVLAALHARIVGPVGASALRRHAGLDLPPTSEAGAAEAVLRLLVERLFGEVGAPLGRRLLAGACQSLPWEQQVEAVEELGLAEWLQPSPVPQRETVEALLARSLVFADLAEETRRELASRARLRRWEDGATLVRAGAPAQWLHLLLEGSAAVWAPEAVGRRRLALLSEGATIGLRALAADGSYTASVTALGPAATISLHREDVAEVVPDPERPAALAELAAQVGSLRLTSVFHEVAEAQVVAFLAQARRETYPPQAVIVRQGDPGDRFFVIRSGRVAVMRDTGGEPERVAVLGPGECFGELAILFGVPRTATVIAQEAVAVLTLSREDLVHLFPLEGRGTRGLWRLSVSRVLKLTGRSPQRGAS